MSTSCSGSFMFYLPCAFYLHLSAVFLIWGISVTLYFPKLPCLSCLYPLKCPISFFATPRNSFFFYLLLSFSLFSFLVLSPCCPSFHLNGFLSEACQTTFLFSHQIASKAPPARQSVSNYTHTALGVFTLLFLLFVFFNTKFFRQEVCFLDFTYYKTCCAITMT